MLFGLLSELIFGQFLNVKFRIGKIYKLWGKQKLLNK